jgi:hypothetical protein
MRCAARVGLALFVRTPGRAWVCVQSGTPGPVRLASERLIVRGGTPLSRDRWEPDHPECRSPKLAGVPPASSGSQNDNRAHVDSAFEDRDVARCALSTDLDQVAAKVHAQAQIRC